MGIGVTKITKATNGAIVLGCGNEQDREKFTEAAKKELGNKYKIEKAKEKLPTIKIIGIDKEDANMKDEDLINVIRQQNEMENIKGYRRCKINEYIRIQQCYKCWGFGHLAKNCKKQVICRICGDKHEEETCKVEEPTSKKEKRKRHIVDERTRTTR
ncbi:hypothetical protein KPH14_007958 [Odynerus spinipes]|uniref:CCHC-type domain-containing protein n=1 Tax=Odynerus spinipes TaxID=1348599 RepID=A0AAD9VNR5_9HYME|nr:hypothetical protein KPH14_007958 [Odynerus spinipes]